MLKLISSVFVAVLAFSGSVYANELTDEQKAAIQAECEKAGGDVAACVEEKTAEASK